MMRVIGVIMKNTTFPGERGGCPLGFGLVSVYNSSFTLGQSSLSNFCPSWENLRFFCLTHIFYCRRQLQLWWSVVNHGCETVPEFLISFKNTTWRTCFSPKWDWAEKLPDNFPRGTKKTCRLNVTLLLNLRPGVSFATSPVSVELSDELIWLTLYQPDGDGKSFVPLSGYWCYWETQKHIPV